MVLPYQLRWLGIAAIAALVAFVLALAIAPAVQAAEVDTEQDAPFVMEEHEDDDENGVTEDENGATEDDENGVTEDDDDEVAPAETGNAGLLGSQGGTALGLILLALGATFSIVTLGRFGTRRA